MGVVRQTLSIQQIRGNFFSVCKCPVVRWFEIDVCSFVILEDGDENCFRNIYIFLMSIPMLENVNETEMIALIGKSNYFCLEKCTILTSESCDSARRKCTIQLDQFMNSIQRVCIFQELGSVLIWRYIYVCMYDYTA